MVVDPSLPEWEGPAQLACSFFSDEHAKTVRYKWCTYPDLPGFYVPRPFLLSVAGEAIPRQIDDVLIPAPVQAFGFNPQRLAPRTIPGSWDFDLSEKTCERVVKYVVRYVGQNYPLYVPKEVFGGYSHPCRIRVQLVVPDEPSQ